MEQADLLRLLGNALESDRIVYGFTGTHASSMYGEARFTNDIDVVAAIDTKSVLDEFLRGLPASEFYFSYVGAARAVAVGGQFNIIHQDSSQK